MSYKELHQLYNTSADIKEFIKRAQEAKHTSEAINLFIETLPAKANLNKTSKLY